MDARISQGSVIPLEHGSRCRKWRLKVIVNGRQKTRRFTGTKKEAKAELERFRADLGRETYSGETLTVREYFDRYSASRVASGNVSVETVDRWSSRFNAICRHIGDKQILDLKPMDIEIAYAALRRGDSPSGKPLSGTYLASIQATCHGAFERAVRDRLIPSNPFAAVERPRIDTEEKSALTMPDVIELASQLDPLNKQHMAIMLMVFQGLRRSEAVNLKWADVDFANSEITVRKSKTKAGLRTIPISGAIQDALIRRYIDMDTRSCADGYVVSDWGDPITPHAVNRWWQRNAASLGLDGFTPHQLRHTYATMLAESDVHPKMMQALLGHESPMTSMKIYAHVHESAKRDAVAALDSALAGTSPGTNL